MKLYSYLSAFIKYIIRDYTVVLVDQLFRLALVIRQQSLPSSGLFTALQFFKKYRAIDMFHIYN